MNSSYFDSSPKIIVALSASDNRSFAPTKAQLRFQVTDASTSHSVSAGYCGSIHATTSVTYFLIVKTATRILDGLFVPWKLSGIFDYHCLGSCDAILLFPRERKL